MAKELGVIPCIIRFFYCAKLPGRGEGAGGEGGSEGESKMKYSKRRR